MTRWTNEQYQEYLEKTKAVVDWAQSSPHKPDPGPESTLQGKIMVYCKEHGYPCLSFRQTARVRGVVTPGWPDMTIVIPGKVVFVELKSATGGLRMDQAAIKRQMTYLGMPVHVIRSYRSFLGVMND